MKMCCKMKVKTFKPTKLEIIHFHQTYDVGNVKESSSGRSSMTQSRNRIWFEY